MHLITQQATPLLKERIFISSYYNRDVEFLMLHGIRSLCLQSALFADTLFILWHQRKFEIERVKIVQVTRDRRIVFVFLVVWRYIGFEIKIISFLRIVRLPP